MEPRVNDSSIRLEILQPVPLMNQLQEPMRQRMAACGMKDIEIDFIDTWAKPGQQGYGYVRMAL